MMTGMQERECNDEQVNEDEGPILKRRKRALTKLLRDITNESKQQLDPQSNATQSPATPSLLQNEFLLYVQLKEQSYRRGEDPLAW